MNDIRDEKKALYRFPPLHIIAFVVFRELETRRWTGTPMEKCMIPKRIARSTRGSTSGPIFVPTWQTKRPFPGKTLPGRQESANVRGVAVDLAGATVEGPRLLQP